MTRRRRIMSAVIVALGMGLTGCGVRSESSPVRVDRDRVPFSLLEATTTTRPTGGTVTAYLVAGKRLVPVTRAVAQRPGPAAAFRSLTDGPSAEEARAGLVSEVPEGEVALVSVRRGVATVRLDSSLDAGGSVTMTPIAQIVLTLTDFESVDRVAFVVGSERVEVPLADGTLSSGPVTRAEYAALVGPR